MLQTQRNVTFQTPLQLRVGYTLAHADRQTPLGASRGHAALPMLVFVHPIRGAYRRILRYLERRPSEDLTQRCFFGLRLCDRLAVGRLGLSEMLQPQACVRSGALRVPAQLASNLWCGSRVLVVASAQFGYDVTSYVAERLTSLRVHFRNCLRSSALQFREFLSKFLSFRSPVTGL